MKIKKHKLHNVFQHRDIEIDLSQGRVIGVTGANGSGKSNLVKTIGANIHGEYPRKLSRMMTLGENSSSMETLIEITPGLDVTISRDLKKNKHVLSFSDGREEVIGADAVNAKLLELLEVEKQILTEVVFIDQGKMESLLFSTATVKERLAQKFFGLEKSGSIEAAIGARINTIPYLVVDESAADLRKEKSALAARVKEGAARLEELSAGFSQEELSDLQSDLSLYLANEKASRDYTRAQEQTRTLADEIVVLKGKADSLGASLKKIPAEKIRARIAEEQEKSRIHRSRGEWSRALSGAQKELSELGAAPCTRGLIDKLKGEIDKISIGAAVDAVHPACRVVLRDQLLTGASADCPTCLMQLIPDEDLPRITARVELDSECVSNQDLLEVLIQRKNNHESSLQSWEKSNSRINGLIENAKRQIEALGADAGEGDAAKWQATLDTYNEIVSQHAETLRSLEAKKKQLLAIPVLEAPAEGVGDFDPAATQSRIGELAGRKAAIEGQESDLRLLERDIKNLKDRIERVEKSERKNALSDEFRASLARLRKAFHPDGAPRELIGRRVARMEQGVNEYLEILNTKFRVQACGGFNFEAIFPDKPSPIEAAELSGGEKIDLSLAFRFSACETFSSSVGLLILDEPSVYLDDATLEHFSAVIERLKLMAETLGMQFIVVTHEKALIPHFDQLIEL